MRRPQALLFDLDGTLVDSRGDIAAACNAALMAAGRPTLPTAQIAGMVGDGARVLMARALSVSDEGNENEALLAQAVASFHAHYLAHPCVHTVLLPGVIEILELAQEGKILCAMVTNKPRDVSLALLDALGIRARLGAVWGGGDGPMKPAPDGLLAVAARLNVAAADAWMIGDGPQDIEAGRAAGCFTVGVPGIAERERLLASRPDLVCDSLHDVCAELSRLTTPA